MASFEARLIGAIKDQLLKTSDDALTKPKQTDAYGYGYAVGYHLGLKEALVIVENLMAEEDEENNRDGRILSLHR
jgi:hypothetical protein